MGKGLLSDTLAMLADELAAMPGTSMIGSSVSVPVPKGAEMVKAMREAAAALSAGAEPVGHVLTRDLLSVEAGDTGTLWPSPSESLDTISGRRDQTVPLYTRPQPATPATVTEEDVERAADAYDRAYTEHCARDDGKPLPFATLVRAALESFANKGQPLPAPPASTETDKQTAAEESRNV